MPTFTQQATLSLIAADLAPQLYKAECALLGCADSSRPFSELGPAIQRLYRTRAETYLLSHIGFVASKARDKALRLAVVHHDIWEEFTESSAKIIEAVAAEAQDIEPFLHEAYRELNRRPLREGSR